MLISHELSTSDNWWDSNPRFQFQSNALEPNSNFTVTCSGMRLTAIQVDTTSETQCLPLHTEKAYVSMKDEGLSGHFMRVVDDTREAVSVSAQIRMKMTANVHRRPHPSLRLPNSPSHRTHRGSRHTFAHVLQEHLLQHKLHVDQRITSLFHEFLHFLSSNRETRTGYV